jgi:hypothetical protein
MFLIVDIEPELVAQAEIEDNNAAWAEGHGRSAVTFSLRFSERRGTTADLLGWMLGTTAFGE